jgi:hypothetical protein
MTASIPVADGSIFISYRREETAYPAGWLFDRLVEHFGKGQVFKDVDSIELGDDFVEVISRAVGGCDVLLALIGDRWLTATGEDGKRRLDDPEDFVRLEIEAALTRNVRVIPVLVEGARMPRALELPPSMANLAYRQAHELSPARFNSDADRLIKALNRGLAATRAQQAIAAHPVPNASPPAKSLSGMAKPPFALASDEEEQRINVRRHPAVLIKPIAVVLGALIIVVTLGGTVLQDNRVALVIIWMVYGVLLIWLAWKAIAWYMERFIVTSKRMMLASGVLRRRVAMKQLANLTDLSFQKSLLGRILGYCELIVESVGQEALETIDHIPYPEQIYLELCDLIFPSADDAPDG